VVWSLADSLIQSRLITFELQRSRDSLFSNARTLYKGSDLASFVSGLPNGDYYFRVRTILDKPGSAAWSKTLLLRVRHQSLVLAFTLFGLGAVVFVSTVLLIIIGNRNAKREDQTS
jgi:hypothetical protein